MLILSCTSKLQLLEGMLKKCLPQALAVNGAVMNINRGNPVGHEVIVDSWPKFKAVLTRPRREVVSDDSDYYFNVYAAFYHDLNVYRKLMLDTDAVNWNQSFRIHGNQDGIYKAFQDSATIKNEPLSVTSYITYMHPNPSILPEYQLEPGFTMSSLNASHVDLLNETWNYGGSEQSRHYLASVVQHFFTTCVMDTDGQPVSWSTMDFLGAKANSYTLPSHRGKHYSAMTMRALAMKVHAAGYPVYGNVALSNVHMQKIHEHRGYQKLSELYHICVHAKM